MRYLLLGIVLLMSCGAVLANDDVEFDEGIDYALIKPAQPTNDPDRIEVVEIFWYGCPHCHSFEPTLGPWIKSAPKDVDFYRLPAVFNAAWEVHARAYFTAEILNVVEKTHGGLFHAMHTEHKVLNNADKLANFYAGYGVDATLFKKTYNSFVVNTKVARAKDMVERYGIKGVPAIVVAGKYLITGSMARSYERMLKITDYLVEQERRPKK